MNLQLVTMEQIMDSSNWNIPYYTNYNCSLAFECISSVYMKIIELSDAAVSVSVFIQSSKLIIRFNKLSLAAA